MNQDQIRERKAEPDVQLVEAKVALRQVEKAIGKLQDLCEHPNAIRSDDGIVGKKTCPDCGNVYAWELDGFANMMR